MSPVTLSCAQTIILCKNIVWFYYSAFKYIMRGINTIINNRYNYIGVRL